MSQDQAQDRSFIAAMVQMRTGLLAGPSLTQATKLIRQAAANGANYVQTPEVSNMMQLNRKALFEHLQSEEDDISLKAYRALAAENLQKMGYSDVWSMDGGWRGWNELGGEVEK